MPDLTVYELETPPIFSFDEYSFFQYNFCHFKDGRLFYHGRGSHTCQMLTPDIKKMTFSVKQMGRISTRSPRVEIEGDAMATDGEDEIILIGGADQTQRMQTTAETHIFSVSKKVWTEGPPMTVTKFYASAC